MSSLSSRLRSILATEADLGADPPDKRAFGLWKDKRIAILSIGSQNLVTGKNGHWNLLETWAGDTIHMTLVQTRDDPYWSGSSQQPHKKLLILGSGTGGWLKGTDKDPIWLVSDQSRRDLGPWKVLSEVSGTVNEALLAKAMATFGGKSFRAAVLK